LRLHTWCSLTNFTPAFLYILKCSSAHLWRLCIVLFPVLGMLI
jgi:hypothetical protein